MNSNFTSTANKLFIKNRKGQRLAILVEETTNQVGLAFVMHGLGCRKETPHIQMLSDSFKNNGYTVVRFDTTNSYGESEGDYVNATTTNYYEDFEDVIAWSKDQPWYQEPFCLAGHSLGGICIALYALKNPSKVMALAPVSTVVSGKLSFEAPGYSKELLDDWKRTGWFERRSGSNPKIIKRLKWSHMEDRLKYDLLPEAEKLTMPVLLIVGENDDLTPLNHQEIFFDAIPDGNKELQIIKMHRTLFGMKPIYGN